MTANIGFEGTAKFTDFLNFSSFGGQKEINLMYTESNQQQSEKNKRNNRQESQFKDVKKWTELCQKLRNQNNQLKKQVKILKNKLLMVQKQDNQKIDSSPIKEILIKPKQQAERMIQQQQELNGYKKQIYEEHKKKLREMRSTVDYVVKCYLQSSKGNTKMKKILQSLREERSVVKLNKLWKQHRKQDHINYGGLQTNLYLLQKSQTTKMKKKIMEMKQIIDFLLNNLRTQVKEMKKQINQTGEKVVNQMKKCMKRFFIPDKEKENLCRRNSINSQKGCSKEKTAHSIVVSTNNFTGDDSFIKNNYSKKSQPPLPPNNKTFSLTPKSYSSTPKNNRSFSNVLCQKSSSKNQTNGKKVSMKKK